MKWRWLINVLAMLSTVLFLISGLGWIRSYKSGDYLLFNSPGHFGGGAWSAMGGVRFAVDTVSTSTPLWQSGWSTIATIDRKYPSNRTDSLVNFLGFGADFGANGDGGHYWGVTLPYVALMILLAILPILWGYCKRRRKPPVGHCVLCGYDLRASKDRCPECGTAIAMATKA